MPRGLKQYTLPSLGILRWLTDPGPDVAPALRGVLIAQLLSGPTAVLMGVVNGILINVAALLLLNDPLVFKLLLMIDLAVGAARLAIIRLVNRAVRRGTQAPMDLYVAVAILWCTVQGVVAFNAMKSDCQPLQVLSGTTIMGLIGPICARNYPAPRLGRLLLCLCLLPFVAGSVLSGERALWVFAVQTPIFLYGTQAILLNYRKLAVASLTAELDSQLRERRDPLTGLLNRRGFLDAQQRHDTLPRHFVVLCLDLDGFKRVNDTLGHPAGDALLQSVARRLENGVRPADAVIRLGGDEFVILAPDMTPDIAADLAERLIERVTHEPYLLEGRTMVRIGLSIGFACAPEDGTDFALLHRRADSALYVAKAQGKGVQRRYTPTAAEAPAESQCADERASADT
jgi:diguanylate cyclase (GGDEF)-like protein